MNKGIIQAKGEWLQFLNSGDLLYEATTLQKIFAREYSADVLYGNSKLVNKGRGIGDYIAPDILSYSHLYGGNPISHQASFFRKRLFDCHLYNEQFRIVSDWEYCLDLILRGCRFEHLDQFVVWYDNNGLSTKMMSARWQEWSIVRNNCPPHLKPDIDLITHYHQVYLNGRFCTAVTHLFLAIIACASRCRNRIIDWRIKIKNKHHR